AVEAEPFKVKLDLFVNLAQFVYDDSNPENPLGARALSGGRLVPNTDAWMFAWQIGAKFNFPKNVYFQVAPVLYTYGGNGDSFNGFYVGGQPGLTNTASMATNQVGINSLLVLEVPAEFGFKIGEIPFRIFGDFAVNFDADDRARAAGHPEAGDQRYAYQIGAGIGQLKTKHDMQLQAFWQHTEQYALDPNLVDSDFFDSRVNIEGVVVQAGYARRKARHQRLRHARGETRAAARGAIQSAASRDHLRHRRRRFHHRHCCHHRRHRADRHVEPAREAGRDERGFGQGREHETDHRRV